MTNFYTFELPTLAKPKQGRAKGESNQIKFKRGNGCKDWADCLTCPKEDCDWKGY